MQHPSWCVCVACKNKPLGAALAEGDAQPSDDGKCRSHDHVLRIVPQRVSCECGFYTESLLDYSAMARHFLECENRARERRDSDLPKPEQHFWEGARDAYENAHAYCCKRAEAAAVERAALPPQPERLAVRFKQPHEAAGAIVGPQTEAQERLEATTGQLLIELAFLLPKGTNVMEHPIAKKLVAFRDAVRGAALPPAPAPEAEHFSLKDRVEALARALYVAGVRSSDKDGLPRLVAEGVLLNLNRAERIGLYRIKPGVAEASALARPRAEDGR